MNYKSFKEQLKGKQHKLDKNKNGKLDAHDFKLLRKEEAEDLEEATPYYNKPSWIKKMSAAAKRERLERERKEKEANASKQVTEESELDEADVMARADYKVGPSGRKSHKQITFKDGSNDRDDEKNEVREETDMNEEMTDAQKAERERLVKGMKKNIDGFKAKYGERAKEVMYATATKQAMKEETIEEGAGQHKVMVTVSDPNHTMVSQRKEKIMKRVIVSADHKDNAVAKAKEFYKKKGYKVHDAEYHSAQPKSTMKTEETSLEESMADSWKKVQSMDKGSVTGGKDEVKKRLAYLNAVHDHHKKFGNDTKKVKSEIESINRSRIAEDSELEEGYVVRYHNPKSEKHGSERNFDSQESAQKHADRGNSVDKSGGKYTVHKTNEKGHDIKEDVDLQEAMSPQQKSDFDRMMAGAMSRAAYNAKWKKPLKSDSKVIYGKNVKEEVELDEAVESGNKGYGYHGQHDSETADKKYSAMHAKVKKVAGEAGHLRDAKKPNVMVKHYLDSRHGRHLAGNEHDHEYIKKDFGKFKKSYKESDFAKESVGFDEEGNLMSEKLTYAQFMEQLLEYTPGPGGVTRVKGRSYGAQYHDPEGDDDADDKPKKAKPAADAPKRGRGRPAGSKSGANQKVTSGKSYGGIATHSLNLPNSNR